MNSKILILFWFVLITTPSFCSENFFKRKEKYRPTLANGLTLISVGSGWGFTSTFVTDPNKFLSGPIYMRNNTYIPFISFEFGSKKNLNVEGSILRQIIGVSYERIFNQVGNSVFYPMYLRHHSISLGLSSKLNIRNFNVLQFHSGVFTGVTNGNSKVDQNFYDRFFIDAETNEVFGVSAKVIREKKVSFGFYVGGSKSFAMSENVLFEVKYNQRFGLRDLVAGNFILNSSEISFSDTPANFNVTGGGGFLTLSLKIVLFDKINIQ